MQRFQNTKLFDLAAAAPLIVWYCIGIAGLLPQLLNECRQLLSAFHLTTLCAILSQTVSLAFLGLQIVLFVIRRTPERKSQGFVPRAVAIVGSNLQLAFLAVPRVEAPLAVQLISTVLVVVGMGAAVYVGFWLGRSFSVLPQARQLVMTGPYRVIRHPLYLTEQIATFGIMLQYAQPWSLLIALASLTAQFPRMHYEEQILSETFPPYHAYMQRTARFVPHIY